MTALLDVRIKGHLVLAIIHNIIKVSVMIKVVPVVLCGGSGSRLWPLSRKGFPKQFLSLCGEKSLFQNTIIRLAGVASNQTKLSEPIIVTGTEHKYIAMEQLREISFDVYKMILEPMAKNTAPAVTMAALSAMELEGDPILIVSPADHAVLDGSEFASSIQLAIKEANNGDIVTLGIKPDRPETGYGYIKINSEGRSDYANSVERFVEKPDEATAQRYIKDGGVYWNAGIFVVKASVWLKALGKHRGDILNASNQAWSNRLAEDKFISFKESDFSLIPEESVDYAVMQNAPGSSLLVKMVILNTPWNDLGSWDAIWDVSEKDENDNAYQGDVVSFQSRNNIVYANERLVSLIGVDGLVVIETADAVLVMNKSHSQEVKKVVNHLSERNRIELDLHRKVFRPWGWYDCVEDGERFKVKRIQVKPKASLSLQMHHHRAEHWIVVKGTAEVLNGEQKILLTENQSTYIPLGALHRLSNPGTIPLEIIEVQSGSYLGEDDIVRLDDEFGRA
ncbi:mannose-1-phosphate guanylyltransferase/mannose-6-phosphate isomerase [Chromobacterium violaceum]|uniref:mannose-1-phosphate guanylyltransferase/mannose-6-phosphate isomerase n=1 Tax=Chromobacterium violaceum TaxID=536 RepID=UPI001FD0C9C2|nr:mannose-1-phosphate guanylyltransferase/mannose-6-phosphate isomerase [Chromobacterium violaceum]